MGAKTTDVTLFPRQQCGCHSPDHNYAGSGPGILPLPGGGGGEGGKEGERESDFVVLCVCSAGRSSPSAESSCRTHAVVMS